MIYHISIDVRLRKDILDPAGRAVENSLQRMDFKVYDVRIGKTITFALESQSLEDAKAQAEDMAQKLLANPVMEDYTIHIQPEKD